MDPGQAHIAGASQACTPHPTGYSAFDPCAARIRRLQGACGLPLAGGLEGLILWLRSDAEGPPRVALGRPDTVRDLVAAPTVLGRELHLDDWIPTIIYRWCPAGTGLARRAGGLLLVPIDLEVLGIKAGPLTGLPVIIKARGAEADPPRSAPDSPPGVRRPDSRCRRYASRAAGPVAAARHGSWASPRHLKPGQSWCRHW